MITKEQALTALDNMDDYAKMSTSIDPVGARKTLELYILEEEQRREEADKLYADAAKEYKGAIRYWIATLATAAVIAYIAYSGVVNSCQT